jgi:hypothetical protein
MHPASDWGQGMRRASPDVANLLEKIRDKETRVTSRHYHFLRGMKKLQVVVRPLPCP